MNSSSQRYIFYRGKSAVSKSAEIFLDKDYTFKIWQPKIYEPCPKGLFFIALIAWWIFYYLRLFIGSEYRIFIIYYKNKKVAHYSVVSSKYFRTPFMENNNLQIGPVGTNKDHRKRGLAFFTIQKILEFYKDKNIKFWYVTRKENEPSVHLIEKASFIKYGEGIKKKRFIGGLFDIYIIERRF